MRTRAVIAVVGGVVLCVVVVWIAVIVSQRGHVDPDRVLAGIISATFHERSDDVAPRSLHIDDLQGFLQTLREADWAREFDGPGVGIASDPRWYIIVEHVDNRQRFIVVDPDMRMLLEDNDAYQDNLTVSGTAVKALIGRLVEAIRADGG